MNTPDPKKRARAAATKAVLADRAAAEKIASEAAALQLAIESTGLQFTQSVAAMKEAFKKQIEEQTAALKEKVKQLNTWAVVNREAEFGDVKTITLCGHKLAFRDSPGKVEFEKGVNEEAVVAALLKLADDEFADLFLRYTTELNREAVGEHWDKADDQAILKNLGIRFSKPEIFSFTPDHESVAAVKSTVPQPEPAAPALREAA